MTLSARDRERLSEELDQSADRVPTGSETTAMPLETQLQAERAWLELVQETLAHTPLPPTRDLTAQILKHVQVHAGKTDLVEQSALRHGRLAKAVLWMRVAAPILLALLILAGVVSIVLAGG